MTVARPRFAGFTLVELLVALVVISIISVAVTTMVSGAANTSLYVTNGTDSVSQVEMAYRRMAYDLRACSQLTFPTTTASAATFTIKTQSDPNNGNSPRTVMYSLTNGSLMEADTNSTTTTNSTLVTGVTSFSVQLNSTTSPISATISITAGTMPSISRSVTIYCRNL